MYGIFNIRKDYSIFKQLGCKVCGEVGVQRGKNAKAILDGISPSKLHLIDPWITFDKNIYPDSANKKQDVQDTFFDEVKCNFAKEIHEQRVIIHRELSTQALSFFDSDYFDFLYIDGNHTYEFVLNDLYYAQRVTMKDRYICGHDFVPQKKHGRWPSVYNAVMRFMEENKTDYSLVYSHWDNFIISSHLGIERLLQEYNNNLFIR